MLNGLAGDGIARGPGAGLYMAQLVAQSFNMSDGPPELPQSDLVWTFVDLGTGPPPSIESGTSRWQHGRCLTSASWAPSCAEFGEYSATYFCGLVLLSIFFFCIHWSGPRKGQLRREHRGEACVKCFNFIFAATCLIPLAVMSVIAIEGLGLLGIYLSFYLCIVGCVKGCSVAWRHRRRSRVISRLMDWRKRKTEPTTSTTAVMLAPYTAGVR